LTGRYVRTGTAASPRVLQILRKKVEDRLKLKELLGENSHLYFGGANKQQPQYKPLNQKIKKKFWNICEWRNTQNNLLIRNISNCNWNTPLGCTQCLILITLSKVVAEMAFLLKSFNSNYQCLKHSVNSLFNIFFLMYIQN